MTRDSHREAENAIKSLSVNTITWVNVNQFQKTVFSLKGNRNLGFKFEDEKLSGSIRKSETWKKCRWKLL